MPDISGLRSRASRETLRSHYSTRSNLRNEQNTRYFGAYNEARPSFEAHAVPLRRPRISNEQNRHPSESCRPLVELGRPSKEQDRPSMMSPVLRSMLKTTTETGDLGMYSIESACQTSTMPHFHHINRLASNHTRPLQQLTNHFSSAVPYPSSLVDDRKRLPSYNRDTTSETSEIVSMYQTAEQETGDRSYSMKHPIHSSFARPKHHRSYTSLRSQAESMPITRPRSPYAYPSRLRRPGFRPSSPALTDCGSIDYSHGIDFNMKDGFGAGRLSPVSMYERHRRHPRPPMSTRSDVSSPSRPGTNYKSSRQAAYVRHFHGHTSDWDDRSVDRNQRASPALSLQSSVSVSNISEVNGVPVLHGPVYSRTHEPPPLYYDYSEGFVPLQNVDHVCDNTNSSVFNLHKPILEDHELSSGGLEIDGQDNFRHESIDTYVQVPGEGAVLPDKCTEKSVQPMVTHHRSEQVSTSEISALSQSQFSEDTTYPEISPVTRPQAEVESDATVIDRTFSASTVLGHETNKITILPQRKSNAEISSSGQNETQELNRDRIHKLQDTNGQRQLGESPMAQDVAECASTSLTSSPEMPQAHEILERNMISTTEPCSVVGNMSYVNITDPSSRPSSAQDSRTRSSRFYFDALDPSLKEFANMLREFETTENFDTSKVFDLTRQITRHPANPRNSSLSASLVKFRSEENLRALKRKAVVTYQLETVVDKNMIRQEQEFWRHGGRSSVRSKTPLIAPIPLSPSKQIRLRTSMSRLIRTLPDLQAPDVLVNAPTQILHASTTVVNHPATSLIKSRHLVSQLHRTTLESRSSASLHARPSVETRPWNVKENYTWMATPDVDLGCLKQNLLEIASKEQSELTGDPPLKPSTSDSSHLNVLEPVQEQKDGTATTSCGHGVGDTTSIIGKMLRNVGRKMDNMNGIHGSFNSRHRLRYKSSNRTSADQFQVLPVVGSSRDIMQALSNTSLNARHSRFSEDSQQGQEIAQAPLRARLSRLKSRLNLAHNLDAVFRSKKHDSYIAGSEVLEQNTHLHNANYQASFQEQLPRHHRYKGKVRGWFRKLGHQ